MKHDNKALTWPRGVVENYYSVLESKQICQQTINKEEVMTKMISQKYNEEERHNLSEIEDLLNKNSAYISIGVGEKAVLQFLPGRKIEEVEKTYNGQIIKKIRFIVTVPHNGNEGEKFFDVGRRSARLIIAKLKEGYTLLKIERIGSGKDTLYMPTEVTG